MQTIPPWRKPACCNRSEGRRARTCRKTRSRLLSAGVASTIPSRASLRVATRMGACTACDSSSHTRDVIIWVRNRLQCDLTLARGSTCRSGMLSRLLRRKRETSTNVEDSSHIHTPCHWHQCSPWWGWAARGGQPAGSVPQCHVLPTKFVQPEHAALEMVMGPASRWIIFAAAEATRLCRMRGSPG